MKSINDIINAFLHVGYIRFKEGFKETFPVEDYLDLFDLAAKNIQAGITGNSSGDHNALQLITGEHMSKCLCVGGYDLVLLVAHCAAGGRISFAIIVFICCFVRTFEHPDYWILSMIQIMGLLCLLFLYCQASLTLSLTSVSLLHSCEEPEGNTIHIILDIIVREQALCL